MMTFQALRVLVFMTGTRNEYRQQIFSNNEVFCGPNCETYRNNDGYRSIQTPAGTYDINEVINKLPEHQQPDLVIVKADHANSNRPANLGSIKCPKVLIVGGIQSISRPIRSLILYGKQESFDFICSDYGRQHLHFFHDAGFKNVFWNPALTLNVYPQPFRLTRENNISFVEHGSQFNCYMRQAINTLKNNSIPISVQDLSQKEAAVSYGKSAICLNFSLGGDINHRVFEVISNGGFLLTDKLSSESGINLLYEDGKDFKSFNSFDELVEISKYYLKNPLQAQNMALSALKKHNDLFSAEMCLNRFYNYVFNDQIEDLYKVNSRKKHALSVSNSEYKRVTWYEIFQDLQLKNDYLTVSLSKRISSRLFNDVKDFQRITFLHDPEKNEAVDILVIGENELQTFDLKQQFTKQPFMELMVLAVNGELSDSSINSLKEAGLLKSQLSSHRFKVKGFDSLCQTLKIDLYEKLMLMVNKKDDSGRALVKLAKRLINSGLKEKAKKHLKTMLNKNRGCTEAIELLESITHRSCKDYQLLFNPLKFRVKKTSRPQKILLITNLFPPQELGGYDRLMADFRHVLKEMGHTVYTLTAHSPQLGSAPSTEPGISRTLKLTGGWKNGQTFTFPEIKARRIKDKNLSVLRSHIWTFNPDVCLLGHIDYLGAGILFELLKHQIPVVHHIAGGWPGYHPQSQPRNALYTKACTSEWVQTELKKKGYDTKQSMVVYPGAVVEYFNFSYSPNFDKLRIAFTGPILPHNGPRLLLNSLATLKDQGYDFTCEIANKTTDQHYLNQLKQFVKDNALTKQVKFTGLLNRQETRRLLGRSNILVSPTATNEDSYINQLEAMSSGLVTISSDTRGVREIVNNKQNSLLFDPENQETLTTCLKMLSDDKELAVTLSKQGKKAALEKFNIVASTKKLVQHFEQMIKLRDPIVL